MYPCLEQNLILLLLTLTPCNILGSSISSFLRLFSSSWLIGWQQVFLIGLEVSLVCSVLVVPTDLSSTVGCPVLPSVASPTPALPHPSSRCRFSHLKWMLVRAAAYCARVWLPHSRCRNRSALPSHGHWGRNRTEGRAQKMFAYIL